MAANILAILIAAGALVVIFRDLARLPQTPEQRYRLLRSLPFLFFTALSLFAAIRAPRGRHPFQIDLRFSLDALEASVTKVAHLRGFAVLVLLAILAFGTQRLLVAFLTTMLLGAFVELAQTTVIGHHGRLAELLPDFLGAFFAVLVVAGLRAVLSSRRPPERSPGAA
jgi:VanZ family protein